MSFHPNDVARRARMSSLALGVGFVLLIGAFFKTQVVQHKQYVMQSEENRLRPIPLPAPRGIIYDRHGNVIAENLPAYSVSITAPSVDSLRSALAQLAPTLQLGQNDVNNAIRRFRRAPTRPTVILPDASIDIVSVLEEHRLDFPRLIIQSVPKRYYPDGPIVASFVGYTGEISEAELNDPKYGSYKPGQAIGKGGLEKQYESILHGKEGVRFDEVDARGRPVRGEGPRPDLNPEGAPPLFTNIDMDLQKFTSAIFADSLQGGAIAIDPSYGQALALFATNHMFGVHLGWTDLATAAPIAERAALAAIAADSEDAWAHTALGSVYFSTRRLDHSLAEFELALQLNPNFSLAQGYYALALSYSGRWTDAYAATQRAIRQSPRDPSSAIYYGVAAYAQFVGS